jgi:hypothetical protein
MSLMWPLFSWSAWAQPDTVVVGNTGEGSALSSVRLAGVGSDSQRGCGQSR